MNEQPPKPLNPDDFARIVVLMNGTTTEKEPFWCYVAVKPNKYDDFRQAQMKNVLDLHNFKEYGEIIVSGKGDTPPNEVTAKVQVMYNADPRRDFNKANPVASVKEAMKELAQKLGKKTEEKPEGK